MKQHFHTQRMYRWLAARAGILLVFAFLVVHLVVLRDYGFTWDFHFHFFGGGKLLGIEPATLEPRALPFVEPDPRRAVTLPYGPLMSIPPVASYLLFHKTLGTLPPDSAYHLPIILWGVAGVGILYAFMKEAYTRKTGILSALILGLMPRYFGDTHNNMKDIPSAVVFALNMWLLWRVVKYRRAVDTVLAALAFAVAFNVKINSVYIPAVFAVWLMFLVFRKRMRANDAFRLLIPYGLLAASSAFLLWWAFWPDPIGQLRHAFLTFGVGTNNIEVLVNGNWYCSGSTVPWYYPLWLLTITTPISVLALWITGGIALLRGKRTDTTPLLFLWLLLPLTRYLVPAIGVIDGIRHFEEVLFPIAAIAAVGGIRLTEILPSHRARTFAVVALLISLAAPVALYHPYQITYFNGLVGGTRGAFGKYDLDYWGTSQKQAVEWVNRHAPANANVHIVMAAAVAGQYLRPDLIAGLNSKGYDESDFVILLNRQSFLYRFFYAYEYFLHHTPAYTVSVRNTPLTWVYDNRTDNRTPRQQPYWQGEDPCIIKYWRGEHR